MEYKIIDDNFDNLFCFFNLLPLVENLTPISPRVFVVKTSNSHTIIVGHPKEVLYN